MSDEKLSLNSYQKENFCVFDGENCNEKNGLGIRYVIGCQIFI